MHTSFSQLPAWDVIKFTSYADVSGCGGLRPLFSIIARFGIDWVDCGKQANNRSALDTAAASSEPAAKNRIAATIQFIFGCRLKSNKASFHRPPGLETSINCKGLYI
jgi:hypothetical protein